LARDDRTGSAPDASVIEAQGCVASYERATTCVLKMEAAMAKDKSAPKSEPKKKPLKTLKEKRAEKRAEKRSSLSIPQP